MQELHLIARARSHGDRIAFRVEELEYSCAYLLIFDSLPRNAMGKVTKKHLALEFEKQA